MCALTTARSRGIVEDNVNVPDLIDEVPAKLRDLYGQITSLTDAFCDARLNDEYKLLCRAMTAELCGDDESSPATKGKPATWASAVVYSIGWVNFLTDPEQSPHVKADDIARAFGVAPATMHRCAKVLREEFELMRFDPRWCLPSRLIDNPLAWLIEIDGIPVDIRHAPREVQEEAFRLGLIPFVPGGPGGGDAEMN
jgi:hypothetical protein